MICFSTLFSIEYYRFIQVFRYISGNRRTTISTGNIRPFFICSNSMASKSWWRRKTGNCTGCNKGIIKSVFINFFIKYVGFDIVISGYLQHKCCRTVEIFFQYFKYLMIKIYRYVQRIPYTFAGNG